MLLTMRGIAGETLTIETCALYIGAEKRSKTKFLPGRPARIVLQRLRG